MCTYSPSSMWMPNETLCFLVKKQDRTQFIVNFHSTSSVCSFAEICFSTAWYNIFSQNRYITSMKFLTTPEMQKISGAKPNYLPPCAQVPHFVNNTLNFLLNKYIYLLYWASQLIYKLSPVSCRAGPQQCAVLSHGAEQSWCAGTACCDGAVSLGLGDSQYSADSAVRESQTSTCTSEINFC